MKFALYIEPLTAFEHSFYTKELLVDSFRKYGHQLDIFIPLQKHQLSKALDTYTQIYKNQEFQIYNAFENQELDYDTFNVIFKMIQDKKPPDDILNALKKYNEKFYNKYFIIVT